MEIKENETYIVCLNEDNEFELNPYKVDEENLEYLLGVYPTSMSFEFVAYCYGKDIEKAKRLCIEEKAKICKENIMRYTDEIEELERKLIFIKG